ncbi:D-alanine--D-alanine ligase [Myxococcus hansupus]|uniref:D-alanine--D-alanine ligase n=1 Tax=Pseudomyxococcus hansupus TaxID=1297742 RepID=A0A0H4WWJ9_9BACT|nr:hypothetical protein [Myxococcus hansupus]AKQ65983.1 D-alanine--D-alanine ligase [Myxococcus hansupus]
MNAAPVAILFQALAPPVINGLRKEAKPGGYSDGGADIAFALRQAGQAVVTPVNAPSPASALDWVFPDTEAGIASALGLGARVFWANTVLFAGHPLEAVLSRVAVVGQHPAAVHRFDDKFDTNQLLLQRGLPVARSLLVAREARAGVVALDAVSTQGLAFPVMVKPIRGRGSQGVTRTANLAELHAAASALLNGGAFGDTLMLEEYLPGEELTVTVLPPASPTPTGQLGAKHWCLRPVVRFDHHDGVMPYNGTVAVTQNSRALSDEDASRPGIQAVLGACAEAARLVDARALIRIDCRAGADGAFRLFDLNMKPNLTGPGRPGRDDQDSLCALSARAEGWSYADLLRAMLAAAWTERS